MRLLGSLTSFSSFILIGLKELDELKQLDYPLDSTKRKKKRN